MAHSLDGPQETIVLVSVFCFVVVVVVCFLDPERPRIWELFSPLGWSSQESQSGAEGLEGYCLSSDYVEILKK